MDWTIEQLLAFATAAEKGSFSAAARCLGRAQSVVSTHIAALEDTIGGELFDRSSRFPTLTVVGRALLPEAQAVLRQSHRFELCALAQAGDKALHLNISLSHGISFRGISETIAALTLRYPYVTGSCQMKPTDEVWSDVKEGRAQLGLLLGDPPPDNTCDILCLGHIQYCAVASKDFPLSKLERVTMQDLSRHRQILPESDARHYLFSSQYWLVNNVFWAMYLAARWTVIPFALAQYAGQDKFVSNNLTILNPESRMPVFNIYLAWNSIKFNRHDILDFFCEDLQKRSPRIFR